MAAAASKPSSTVEAADDDKKKAASPSTSKTSNILSQILRALLFITPLLIGIIIGGYITAQLLESEYQIIVSELRSTHHAAIEETQSTHSIQCQSMLSDQKQSYDAEVAKLKIHINQQERAFHSQSEKYIKETTMTYKLASEGLDKSSQKLMQEKEKYAELELSSQKLKEEVDICESIMLQLEQADKRNLAIRNTLTETNKQIEQLKNDLNGAEEELDRRDIERAECDDNYRNLLQCRKSLNDNINSSHESKECECHEEELRQQVTELEERVLLGVNDSNELREVEQEKEFWENKATLIINKVSFRAKKEVLERFGPGPHFVKMTLSIQGQSENETFLLELAPLDMMPHTIHMFLSMVEKKLLTRGTMVLAREHILVGGPIDAHDEEKNQELEDLMLNEGFFPHGALLFSEYSADYPHTQWTFGFNHLGGPIFYVNVADNTELHGPSSSSLKDGDPCFAKVVEGLDLVQRILAMPKTEDDSLETAIYIVDTELVNVRA